MDRKKTGLRRAPDIVFLILCALVFATAPVLLIIGEQESSHVESRELQKIPVFSPGSFIDGSYQSALETGLADQFVGSEGMKRKYGELDRALHASIYNRLQPLVGGEYRMVAESLFVFGEGDHLLRKPPEAIPETVAAAADAFSRAIPADVGRYLYFIEDSAVVDFEAENDHRYYEAIKGVMAGFNCDSLPLDSYEQYAAYYYKTDHHWNSEGAYFGYRDTARLLGVDSSLKPVRKLNFPMDFHGSFAKGANLFDTKDRFGAYRYELPPHDIWVNGLPQPYIVIDEYENGIYPTEPYVDHYSICFGPNVAEVIFDYYQQDADNLLLIGNSFDNPISEALASHFNRTYVIDLRFFETLDLSAYIAERGITKVLVIGNIMLFDSVYVQAITGNVN